MALLRFVLGPQGDVVADLRGKLPGRGFWVSATHTAVEAAVARGLFGKAARRNVTVSPALASEVEGLLRRSALEILGLANRAGLVTLGAAKVEARLARAAVGALITAQDGSPREAGRFEAMACRLRIPVIRSFTAAELSLALGRQNVVHAALNEGPLTRRFLIEAVRLDGFRNTEAGARRGGIFPDPDRTAN